jgi:radical SAM-linked protein
MPDETTFRLRVMFCKRGRAAMLSHLEVARALERAVRRAGLPYAVSHGFSPHMRISFGSALPVGVGGLQEYFDIFLTRYVEPSGACALLRSASVPDLAVGSCDYIGAKEPAASAAFPVATYEAVLSRRLDCPPVPETVTVIRKKKERVLLVADFLAEGPCVKGDTVSFSLVSKQTGSLRPDVFLQVLLENEPDVSVRSITRVMQSPGIL